MNLPDFCYLTGACLGDGCLYYGKGSYQFSITSEDVDFCETCQDKCKSVFGKSGNIRTINKNGKYSYSQLVVCSKDIVSFLLDLTDNRCRIPIDELNLNNKSNLAQFLLGVMDSDGWVCKVMPADGHPRYRVGFKNVQLWTAQIKEMLSSMGVKTGVMQKRENYRYGQKNKDSYTFSINTRDYSSILDFKVLRKQKILDEYREKYGISANSHEKFIT